MRRFLFAAVLIAAGCAHATPAGRINSTATSLTGEAAPPAPLEPKPNAAETKFVKSAQRYLAARFPTAAAAQAAGYRRYTAEDLDGVITYTNFQWFADDLRHPTQLWYDVRGHFLGADYTTRVTDRSRRPNLWGLQPGRWSHFMAHMHYVVSSAGKTDYRMMLDDDYQANGGDPLHPSALPIVRAGYAKKPSDVILIFQLPEMWVASVWLIPNPNGAFAESNPLVKATAGAQQEMDPH